MPGPAVAQLGSARVSGLSVRCGLMVIAREIWSAVSKDRDSAPNIPKATRCAAVESHGCAVGNSCSIAANLLCVFSA